MTPPTPNSPDLLCAQILAEATRESEAIRQRARADAEAVLAAAQTKAEQIRREQQDQARMEAARRRELILATAAIETARLRSTHVEAILESIHDASRRLLQDQTIDGRETIVTLAAAAIRRMAGNDFVLKLAPASLTAFGEGLVADIARRSGRDALHLALVADATATDGGVLVESADGGQLYDNRLRPRLERLWPELRRQLAVHFGLTEMRDGHGGAP